jgi:hypothetical protein
MGPDTIIVRNINNLFSLIHRSSRKKIRRKTVELNGTISKINLTDI